MTSRPRRVLPVPFAVLLAFVGALLPTRADDPTGETPEQIQEALQTALDIEANIVQTTAQIRRSTVSVVHKRFPRKGREIVEGEPARPVGVGSGVLVERKGKIWVVTNVHVVDGADEIEVVGIDGVVVPVKLHDSIALYDIALLAFDKRPRDLKPVRIEGRASRDLEVGSWVVASGNPFSLALDGQCVTSLGVVSGKDRILGGQFFYGNAIQHDAPVNPGNSGGPLWDLSGNLLGINGKISSWSQFRGARPSNTGASYSLPIQQVGEFLLALIDRGTDARAGYLGVDVETATDESGSAAGALVKKINEKSPAAKGKAAILAEDVITTVFFMQAWHRIRTASDLTNLLALAPAGSYLKVRYRRGKVSYVWSGRLTGDA